MIRKFPQAIQHSSLRILPIVSSWNFKWSRNNNEGSSWYSQKKPWIKLAALFQHLDFAISLYMNYFSSPKLAKTNAELWCYAYFCIFFLWRINRKQPFNTTHGRCMTSNSIKVAGKNNNPVYLSSDKNTHNNNPTFCTQKIQTPLPVEECNQIFSRRECTISSKQEGPRGIFPQALISMRAISKYSMPSCPRTSTDYANSLLD